MISTEFNSLDDMWYATLAALLQSASKRTSRDGDTIEMTSFQGIITDPSKCWVHNSRRAASPFYAAGEILWYASGSDDIKDITPYAPSYARHAELNGCAYGAYGRRLKYDKSLVTAAVKALKEAPDSRRCVVSLWQPFDLVAGHGPDAKKDVPCTLSWQFMIRDGALEMIVTMRSNDVWLGLPYDAFWNCTVQRIVANELGVKLGSYTHQVGSMHLYERNLQAAKEALKVSSPSVSCWSRATDTWKDLTKAATVEQRMRMDESWSGYETAPVISRTLLTLCQSWLLTNGDEISIDSLDPAMAAAVQTWKKSKEK